MPQITVTTVNGKVVVNGRTLESWEVLQYRKYSNDTIRFANRERVADLPILPSSLSEVSINGVVPTTFDELDAALLTLFPALPQSSSPGGGSSYLVKTYAEMQALIDASELIPGTFYNITNAVGGETSLIIQAYTVNRLSPVGIGKYANDSQISIFPYDIVTDSYNTGLISLAGTADYSGETSVIDFQPNGINIFNQASDGTTYQQIRIAATGCSIDKNGSIKPLVGIKVEDDFADNAAAAAGGIPVGGLYHTTGTVRIRTV